MLNNCSWRCHSLSHASQICPAPAVVAQCCSLQTKHLLAFICVLIATLGPECAKSKSWLLWNQKFPSFSSLWWAQIESSTGSKLLGEFAANFPPSLLLAQH